MPHPSKYTDDMCDKLLEVMGQGLSLTAFCGMVGISRQTANVWKEKHPEFAEAVQIGQAMRTLYLEKGLLETENGPKVQARVFALKNASPEEWRDIRSTELTGAGGGAIEVKRVAPEELTDEELAAIVAGKK